MVQTFYLQFLEHQVYPEWTIENKRAPDATCIDVENPTIAVPMKRTSKTQPAQAAKRRVPTTHLGVDCCFADVEIKHSSE